MGQGIGPIPAVRQLFEKTGLYVKVIDVFELNEAFAGLHRRRGSA